MDTSDFEIFPWSDEFLTQLPEVDRQHQRLVELINRLARTVLEGTGEAGADEIVAELRDYALYHFETEESIWQRYFQGDPWYKEHRRAHQGFTTELDRTEKTGATQMRRAKADIPAADRGRRSGRRH